MHAHYTKDSFAGPGVELSNFSCPPLTCNLLGAGIQRSLFPSASSWPCVRNWPDETNPDQHNLNSKLFDVFLTRFLQFSPGPKQ